jgi:hypothetical protein
VPQAVQGDPLEATKLGLPDRGSEHVPEAAVVDVPPQRVREHEVLLTAEGGGLPPLAQQANDRGRQNHFRTASLGLERPCSPYLVSCRWTRSNPPSKSTSAADEAQPFADPKAREREELE